MHHYLILPDVDDVMAAVVHDHRRVVATLPSPPDISPKEEQNSYFPSMIIYISGINSY